ncbi:MAG: hypothetical protein K1060chlam1_01260 [Candidatus Anoxychlamydiales bacterium]|nr:hypothetical protein [Candidatus Anoxychlamydiales bacterium]
MKKVIFIFLSFFLAFQTYSFAKEKNKEVIVYFFWGKGCRVCDREKIFLDKLQNKYPTIKIYRLEAWGNQENKDLLIKFSKELDIDISGLPITVVGNKAFVGYLDENTTGKNIENAVINALKYGSTDISQNAKNNHRDIKEKKHTIPEKIKIPFFGEIEIKNLSLPLITILFGAIDGFNPCAMWALLMLLSFLITLKSRKKILFLGSIFIVISAVIYFMFMVAWLNFMLFFSYINWVKILIGVIAILGGGYYLKEYFFNKESVCKVTSRKYKKKIVTTMEYLTEKKGIVFAILGISLLAFLVNLIELICSAGLPVIYTQILSLSSLSTSSYYLYVLLYIFVFMLDDLLVFFIAVFSLHLLKLTTKYSRFSHLIGGIVLLVLGSLLIFKPEWLMF